MYEKRTKANAQRALADASFYARKKVTEAELYANKWWYVSRDCKY